MKEKEIDYKTAQLLELCGAFKSIRNDSCAELTSITQSLAQKWLREIHNLNVSVWCNACGWAWELEQTNGTHISIMDIDAGISGTLTESGMFEIYEDALELGLVEALKYIILERSKTSKTSN